MKILQLGVGSVGEVIARTVAGEPEVDQVVLADIDPARPAAVAAKLPAGKAETLQLDVRTAPRCVRPWPASIWSSTASSPSTTWT